jgi:hypothetical protein
VNRPCDKILAQYRANFTAEDAENAMFIIQEIKTPVLSQIILFLQLFPNKKKHKNHQRRANNKQDEDYLK